MITEHFIYWDRTQTINTNSDGVVGCKLTEWDKEKNENQVIEVSLIDDSGKDISNIFISKNEFIKAAKKIMVE